MYRALSSSKQRAALVSNAWRSGNKNLVRAGGARISRAASLSTSSSDDSTTGRMAPSLAKTAASTKEASAPKCMKCDAPLQKVNYQMNLSTQQSGDASEIMGCSCSPGELFLVRTTAEGRSNVESFRKQRPERVLEAKAAAGLLRSSSEVRNKRSGDKAQEDPASGGEQTWAASSRAGKTNTSGGSIDAAAGMSHTSTDTEKPVSSGTMRGRRTNNPFDGSTSALGINQGQGSSVGSSNVSNLKWTDSSAEHTTHEGIKSGGGSTGSGPAADMHDSFRLAANISPRMLFQGLDEYVVGQDNVKKELAVRVFNHYNIVAHNARRRQRVTNQLISGAASSSFSATSTNAGKTDERGGFKGSAAKMDDKQARNWYHDKFDSKNQKEHQASQQATKSSESAAKLLENGHDPLDWSSASSGLDRERLISDEAKKRKSELDEEPQAPSSPSASQQQQPRQVASHNALEDQVDVTILEKSNVLLIGPTGSGKTLMAKTLAKMVGVPLVIFDATCLTQAGYIGEDVEQILYKLYQEADYDVELCQRGIVYLDEVDKIAKSHGPGATRDVSGEGVQQALLKLLEGTVANVPKRGGHKSVRSEYVHIDTSEILFVCGGAFSGLEKHIARRTQNSSIGFEATIKPNSDDGLKGVNPEQLLQKCQPRDLIAFGMIPEFIGRFSRVVATSQLTTEQLVKVLTQPKNALVKQYRSLFALQGVEFLVTDGALRKIAELASERKLGARGLRSIMDEILSDTMFVLPEKNDVTAVIVHEEAVLGAKQPYLVKKGKSTVREILSKADKALDEDAELWSDQVEQVAVGG